MIELEAMTVSEETTESLSCYTEPANCGSKMAQMPTGGDYVVLRVGAR